MANSKTRTIHYTALGFSDPCQFEVDPLGYIDYEADALERCEQMTDHQLLDMSYDPAETPEGRNAARLELVSRGIK